MPSPGRVGDSERSRLLAYALLLLAGFVALALVFAFFVGGPFEALAEAPVTWRVGVAALALAFAALGWDRDRTFVRRERARARRWALEVGLDNRLKATDAALGTSDAVGAPLSMEGVQRLLLDAAVELTGADSGLLDFFEDTDDELAVGHRTETSGSQRSHGTRATAEFEIEDDGRPVARLTLVFPKWSGGLDPGCRDVVEDYALRAGRLLLRARELDRERASTAYLEAANLVRSRFLTTISHELRTPLTSIIGYSKTLNHHWERLADDQKRDFVREIEKQGGKMARLVERILEAARVELQGIVIEPVEHDVRETITEALAPFLATEPRRLHVALPEKPIEAEIDPFVLDQVISNVVDNSLRYTDGSVRVSLDAYRSSITIAISDEGPGIDPERLNLVLEPLYRIDENVQSGTGLGLHIVRTLVEAHGGRGEIRSGSSGTSIAIKLPRSAAARISGRVPPLYQRGRLRGSSQQQ